MRWLSQRVESGWRVTPSAPDASSWAPAPAHRAQHKLYFDELYDALFSRPAQVIAQRLRDAVEEPVVQGSLGEIGAGISDVGRRHGTLQNGLLRSYALVIAGSVAVLAIVFLAVR